MYFQPIKNEDPRLDFYTVYKREAMEYDAEWMRKYNEELNITLIFVRFLLSSRPNEVLTTFTGRSVFRRQFRIYPRRPVEAQT